MAQFSFGALLLGPNLICERCFQAKTIEMKESAEGMESDCPAFTQRPREGSSDNAMQEDRVRTIAGYLLKNNARFVLRSSPDVL